MLGYLESKSTIFSYSSSGIPAYNQKGERLLLYTGIVDILQCYRLKKRLEHLFKSIITDGVRQLFQNFENI